LLDILKGQCLKIFSFRFFYESSSLKPLWITEGQFRIFGKFSDIRKTRCTTGINTTNGKFATGTAGAMDTGVTKLPPVSMTPAVKNI
jgi:hypothetical protein